MLTAEYTPLPEPRGFENPVPMWYILRPSSRPDINKYLRAKVYIYTESDGLSVSLCLSVSLSYYLYVYIYIYIYTKGMYVSRQVCK